MTNSSILSGVTLGLSIIAAGTVLFIPGIESSQPNLTLLLSFASGGLVVAASYQRPWTIVTGFRSHALLLALGIAIAYGLMASTYSINHHHNFGTTVFDLSIYDNLFYQTVHGKPLGTSLIATGYHTAAHFDPILVLLSPLYALYPRAELLLVLQSFWLASAAIPIYLLTVQVLGRPGIGLAMATALLLHPGLHGANFYDFHSLSLIAPLIVWALYFLEIRSYRPYWIVFALLLLCREDIPLLTVLLGIHVLLSRQSRTVGHWTILLSALYFIAVRTFILTSAGGEAHSYAYYYSDLIPDGGGASALILNVLRYPLFTLRHITTIPKLLFLATLFVPVLFLPVLARRGKILLLFGLAVTLLASRGALHTVHFQYATLLYPISIALVPFALEGFGQSQLLARRQIDVQRLIGAFVPGMLTAGLLVSAAFGGLYPNDAFRSGFGPFMPRMTSESRVRYDWLVDARSTIPPSARVSASRHMAPQVSNRYWIHRFPDGWGADFLLLDQEELKAESTAYLEQLLRSGAYSITHEYEGRWILARRQTAVLLPPPPER